MANKDGDKSFFSRFRRNKEDKENKGIDAIVAPEPEEENQGPEPPFPATQLLESDSSDSPSQDPSQTVDLNWEENEARDGATKVVTDVTATREPTAVLDVPLSADDGEPTTLRLALMKSEDLAEADIPDSEIHDEVELEQPGLEIEDPVGGESEPKPEPEPETAPEPEASEPAPIQWADQAQMDCKALGDTVIMSGEAPPPGYPMYAEALARLIRSCETPMSIAINTDPGAGGAAFMKMIMEDLLNHDEGETRPIWFNAWDYSVFGLASQLPLNFLLYLSKVLSKVVPKEVDSSDPRRSQKQRLERAQKDILELGNSLYGHPPKWDTESGAPSTDGSVGASVSHVALMDKLRIVKRGVKQIVDDYLETMNASKMVIFIEGLDVIPPAQAASFLLSLRRTLSFEGCALVSQCNVQRLVKPFTGKDSGPHDHEALNTVTKKFFNLSFSAPLQEQGLESYLESALKRAGMSLDSENRAMFTLLLKNSVGPRIGEIHEVINTLVVSDLLRKSGVFLDRRSHENQDQRLLNRILFGLACLKRGFHPVFSMLGEEISEPLLVRYPLLPLLRKRSAADGPVEGHIAATIRARLEADETRDKETVETMARKGARYLLIFRNTVFDVTSSTLNAAQTDLFDCGIRLISYHSGSNPGLGLEDNGYWLINGFCRRVMDELLKRNPEAPELHSARAVWIEGISGHRYKAWHNPSPPKSAWGADRLHYFLDLDSLEKDRLSVGMRFNLPKMPDFKLSRDNLLKIPSLKQLKSGGFVGQGPDNQGWIIISKELRGINWAEDKEAIKTCASEFNNLIKAVKDRFDIPGSQPQTAGSKKVRVQAPCPKCGKDELESVGVGKDGAIQLRCRNCNAKVASKSKAPSK